jgi:hypothetical protein
MIKLLLMDWTVWTLALKADKVRCQRAKIALDSVKRLSHSHLYLSITYTEGRKAKDWM